MTTSWMIVNKKTGVACLEVYSPHLIKRLNTEKYKAVPVKEYLGSLCTKGELQP